MKIRIKGNYVRYRLTRSEVEEFSKEGYLEEETEFLSGKLVYALQARKGLKDLDIDMTGNRITLFFPDSEKESWYNSERVGYERLLTLPNGNKAGILLEKDFVCLDNVQEDQSDNYPNPNAIAQ